MPAGATHRFITVTNSCNLTTYSSKPFIPTFPCGGVLNSSSFAPRADLATAFPVKAVQICDIDGDGRADLVNDYASFSVQRNTSTVGNISFAPELNFGPYGFRDNFFFSDLDGDGKPDIALPDYATETVTVLRNTSTIGNISFAPQLDLMTEHGPFTVSANDLDGDGKPELIVSHQNADTVSVYRNTSTVGNLSFAPRVNFISGYHSLYVTTADLDGDGKPDLAVANIFSGDISILRNTCTVGVISFAAKIDFVTGDPRSIAAGDLDGDGKLDLAVINDLSNTMSVLRNTSSPGVISFAPKINYATGTAPINVGIGDIDGDGKPDLAETNGLANSVYLFKNTSTIGNISFAPKISYTTGVNPWDVSIGDLDGDGKPEITVANLGNNFISVFKNMINVTVTPDVSITASSTTACAGDPATFIATAVNGGTAPSYQWQVNGIDVGTNSATFTTNTLAGNDLVKVFMTSNLPCVNIPSATSNPISITIKPVPVISFNPSNPAMIFGNSIQLNATITGSASAYLWTPATGLNDPTIPGPVASPATTAIYNLNVTATNGCVADKALTVSVWKDIYIPNAFTPNGDTHNDIFLIPPGTSLRLQYFIIYDRYGNKIFSTTDINNGWDGTYKGARSPQGAYVYIIKGSDLKGEVLLKGSVLVIR